LAWPAGICNLILPVTFFAMDFLDSRRVAPLP
jgi:hypothetical protein